MVLGQYLQSCGRRADGRRGRGMGEVRSGTVRTVRLGLWGKANLSLLRSSAAGASIGSSGQVISHHQDQVKAASDSDRARRQPTCTVCGAWYTVAIKAGSQKKPRQVSTLYLVLKCLVSFNCLPLC